MFNLDRFYINMSQIVGRGKTINKLLNNHPVKLGRGNVVMSPKTNSKPVRAVSPPSMNTGNLPFGKWLFKVCGTLNLMLNVIWMALVYF